MNARGRRAASAPRRGAWLVPGAIPAAIALAIVSPAGAAVGAGVAEADPSPATTRPGPPASGPTSLPTQPQAAVTEPPATTRPTDDAVATQTPDADAQDAPQPLPPTELRRELAEIRPGLRLKQQFDEIAARRNLRVALAHTLLFQQASGGPGRRGAGGGDLDLLAEWAAVNPDGPDRGVLRLSGEYRYQIGDQPPAELGGEIGSLLRTTRGFGERPVVVKEFFWDQRLAGDRLRLAVGRLNPDDQFGAHRLQSANSFFLNEAFSSNPTVAFPGPGLAGVAQWEPARWLYVAGGISDANGRATVGNPQGFFTEGQYFTFVEAALTPTLGTLGAGRYRVAGWRRDANDAVDRPDDAGMTLAFDQDLHSRVNVFVRYGNADGEVTGVDSAAQAGLGLRGTLGERSILGVAAGWARPDDRDLRDEKALECFQRVQASDNAQLTFSVQAIVDPAEAPEDDVVAVFSLRLRLTF